MAINIRKKCFYDFGDSIIRLLFENIMNRILERVK